VIDDRRFAETLARGQRSRGASARAIAEKLRARGVADATLVAAIPRATGTTTRELAAARALVRRNASGVPPARVARGDGQAAIWGVLARAGFSLEVARRALEVKIDDDAF
jgi:regulatory protein